MKRRKGIYSEVVFRGRYLKEHFTSSKLYDKGSFRYKKVVKRGQKRPHLVLVACPIGKWTGKRCRVGMKLVHILHPCSEEPERCL